MISLYDHPLSPYGQKVKIAMAREGPGLRDRLAGRPGRRRRGGRLRRGPTRAPRSRPLVDGDVRVFDSTVILEYLEDAYPTPSILPKAPG